MQDLNEQYKKRSMNQAHLAREQRKNDLHMKHLQEKLDKIHRWDHFKENRHQLILRYIKIKELHKAIRYVISHAVIQKSIMLFNAKFKAKVHYHHV
jgi:hypothetical protein